MNSMERNVPNKKIKVDYSFRSVESAIEDAIQRAARTYAKRPTSTFTYYIHSSRSTLRFKNTHGLHWRAENAHELGDVRLPKNMSAMCSDGSIWNIVRVGDTTTYRCVYFGTNFPDGVSVNMSQSPRRSRRERSRSPARRRRDVGSGAGGAGSGATDV